MEYRNLGRSGVKVSPICLGTMMFGGPTDEARRTRIVASARGRRQLHRHRRPYTDGRSEEISGRAIDADARLVGARDQGREPDRRRPQRQRPVAQMDHAGLRGEPARLGTDYVDIYYLHKEDHGTPLGRDGAAPSPTSMRAGQIRYFGVSNYRAWRVAEICRICDEIGIDRPIVASPITTR